MNLSRLASPSVILLALSISGLGPAAVAHEPEAPPARFVREWGSKGNAPGQFDFPIGVAVERDGQVLVTDFYNARVQRFSPEGKFLAAFGVLPNPGGIAVDHHGNIYLTHFSAMRLNEVRKPDRVSVYAEGGNLLRQWGRTGTGGGMVGPYPIFGLRPVDVMGTDQWSVVDVTRHYRSDGVPGVDKWAVISEDHAGNPIGMDGEGVIWIHDHDFGGVSTIARTFEEYVRVHCLKLPGHG